MALDAGLRSRAQIAGIVALSGGIDQVNLPRHEIATRPPVLLMHGTGDAAIPVSLARDTRRILQDAGIEPEYHELRIGHEITVGRDRADPPVRAQVHLKEKERWPVALERTPTFHMMRLITLLCLMLAIPATGSEPTIEQLEESLRATETAFAQTMADRDLDAFASFLDDGAIFSTPRRVLRGSEEIIEGWRPLYEGPEAPFSWRPVRAHVLEGGAIGGTTGPVIDRDGILVGQFVSTWKRQSDGSWKIILDIAPDCQ